jgi:hypothetical protein
VPSIEQIAARDHSLAGAVPVLAALSLCCGLPDAHAQSDSIHIDSSCGDITCTVQASEDLIAWSDIASSIGGAKAVAAVGSGAEVSDDGNGRRQVSIRIPSSAPRMFFRLQITFRGGSP